jgi:hypothetical protein
MLELITALILLGTIMVGLAVQDQTLARAGLFYTQQAQAICVVDNTLERLSTRSDWTPDQIRALLAAELAAADMPRPDDITADLLHDGHHWQLRIQRADGRILAAIHLPAAEVAP